LLYIQLEPHAKKLQSNALLISDDINTVMLSSRGQVGLGVKILSSDLKNWPRPQAFVLELFILASWKWV